MSTENISIDVDMEKEELISLKTINEKWHIYELEDNTIIKTKFVLMNIVAYGEENELKKRLANFASTNLVVVYSPKEIRGPKDKAWTAQELEEHITGNNLKFRQIEDGGMNTYETEKSIIQVEHRVAQIDNTSKYDKNGMPAYIVRSKTSIILSEKNNEESLENKNET